MSTPLFVELCVRERELAVKSGAEHSEADLPDTGATAKRSRRVLSPKGQCCQEVHD